MACTVGLNSVTLLQQQEVYTIENRKFQLKV
jgi:hypothetical protein